MNKISVAIPCYEMHNIGAETLEYSLLRLENQTFTDFNVIISDNSNDNKIEILCDQWANRLDIKYYKNEIRNAAGNTNNAIKKSDGEFIKVLCQDDLLFDDHSLEIISDNLDYETSWLFTSYVHSYDRVNFFRKHIPSTNPYIAVNNTLGTPSALTIRNIKELPDLDSNLSYCYDCAWYYELYNLYGIPKIIDEVTMINFLSDKSVTSSTTDEMINKENRYIINKYGLK